MKKSIYLYHIIYILFLSTSFSQNLHLNTTGKDSISNKFIKQHKPKNTFPNLKELNNEIDLIEKEILKNGYYNATLSKKTKTKDSTYTLNIKLNQQYKDTHIYYNSNHITTKELHNSLDKDSKIHPEYFTTKTTLLEHNLNNIIKHLTKKGQTFSSCQLSDIQIKNNIATARLTLTTSKTNHITDIKIKGYDRFPKKFIRHFLKLKNNQTLNLDEIEKKSTYINNLRFANEIKKPEILFSKDSTIVYLNINKQKSNSFEGFLGFSTNPETSKLDFNGNINLQLINNLNSGEELLFKYQSTENSQRRINVKTRIPYIFNSPFSIEGELDIFKKDSSFTSNTQVLQAKYTINRNIELGLGIKSNTSNSLLETTLNTEDFKKNSYLLNFLHQKPNQTNKLFLHKTRTQLELSLSKRKTKTSNTNQQNIFFSSEYTFQLNKKNSFYINNESNYLITDQPLENELLYIGGINSIRGFQENSIPSAQYSIFNTEYRITLNNTLYIHTVIDYATTKNQSTNKFDNLFGLGFGFGLKSKSNLLRFIMATNKTKDTNIKLSEAKIHLSLSSFF